MFCRVTAILLICSVAAAQEPGNPEELRKLYHDALAQLKAAQDRKNELAAENERLSARVSELEQQLARCSAESMDFAERTWFLRSHYAAWQQFIQRYPRLKLQWEAFLRADTFDIPTTLPELESGQIN
ncbi:MAG: hypothetical protein NZ561_09745 [Phycisphaerae bacterium]|nr:hypothetical protein [Phycisphaerae bacterium]MDW8262755.1 hypothetical protein [Phycisphaerales bacterium]